MLIKIRPTWELPENRVTPETAYFSRRKFFGKVARGVGLTAGSFALTPRFARSSEAERPLTPEKVATSFNNYYEFGLDKDDPAKHVGEWTPPKPWQIKIGGLVDHPKT